MSDAYVPQISADLATLKARLGTRGTTDDELLTNALIVAEQWVSSRVFPSDRDPSTRHDEVSEAILLFAARLYGRKNTPHGESSGWTELGIVQFVADDPDIRILLERHLDYDLVGLA